jgi:hypothetical protein
MSATEQPAEPAGSRPRRWITRRGFLGASGLAASGLLLPSRAAPASLSPAQSRLTLQIAQVGSVFPVEFPAFEEAGSARSRATAARLRTAVRRLSPGRLALVRAGATDLAAAGLLDVGPEDLLAGIGQLAGTAHEAGLTAVVALAAATVSRHFDPNSDAAAQVWIGGLRRMRQRGVRPAIPTTTMEQA